jgi:hypothetical protein
VWDLSEHIRKRSLELWHPGKHLCVDEAIARFTGRASEIVIIKTKPTLHIIWDDNLFNTVPMLEYLRKEGVGCAGTVRTTATRTEERFEDAARAEAQEPATRARGLKKLSKERFNGDLVRLKTQFSHQLEWGEAYWALSANKTVLQAAWRDSQVVLFATTVADGKQMSTPA